MSRMSIAGVAVAVVAAVAVSLLAAAPAQAGDAGPHDILRVDVTQPLPKGLKAKGATVEQVWSWTEDDRQTKGYAVFSVTEKLDGQRLVDRKLYVQLYRGKPGKLKQARLVQDGVSACELDLTAAFVSESISVTDVDTDGKPELTFAYDLACRSDVSPATRKLLVLEGTAKYALRGEDRVDVGGGETMGGEFKTDGFGKEDQAKAYATTRWAALLGK